MGQSTSRMCLVFSVETSLVKKPAIYVNESMPTYNGHLLERLFHGQLNGIDLGDLWTDCDCKKQGFVTNDDITQFVSRIMTELPYLARVQREAAYRNSDRVVDKQYDDRIRQDALQRGLSEPKLIQEMDPVERKDFDFLMDEKQSLKIRNREYIQTMVQPLIDVLEQQAKTRWDVLPGVPEMVERNGAIVRNACTVVEQVSVEIANDLRESPASKITQDKFCRLFPQLIRQRFAARGLAIGWPYEGPAGRFFPFGNINEPASIVPLVSNSNTGPVSTTSAASAGLVSSASSANQPVANPGSSVMNGVKANDESHFVETPFPIEELEYPVKPGQETRK